MKRLRDSERLGRERLYLAGIHDYGLLFVPGDSLPSDYSIAILAYAKQFRDSVVDRIKRGAIHRVVGARRDLILADTDYS